MEKDRAPRLNEVALAWKNCYEAEERRLISELEKLTPNQQDILKALTIMPTQEITSQKFLLQAGIPASSLQLGAKTLLEKDIIYQVKTVDPLLPHIRLNQYRVLDPLLGFALKKYI